MGKYRPFIILGIAVIIAFVTSVLIYNYLQRKAKVKDVTLETQSIAVAKVDLNWGTVVNKEMIEMKPFLTKSLPAGHFSDTSSLMGRVLVSLHPEKAQTPITKTVLENILVLAAGPEIQTKGKEERPSAVDVITLEVTPEEAEKLGLAATQGKILLALRNFSDTEDVVTKGMTIPTLLASYSSYGSVQEGKVVPVKTTGSKKPTPVMGKKIETGKPALEKKPAFAVELIKGNKVSEVKFEGGEI